MKNLFSLIYIALALLWLAINRDTASALILFVTIILYFVAMSFNKKKTPNKTPAPPEEFHNDFSKVGSANPQDPTFSHCSKRRTPPAH